MRRSIALKIFSIALLLLLLMVFVAAGSIFAVRGVRDELAEIADCYTPLAQSMSRINVHALEQELHRERLLDLHVAASPDAQDITNTRALFDEKSQAVDEEIQSAQALLGRCGEGPSPVLERGEAAHFQPMVQGVAKEQRDLRELSGRILALVERKEMTAAAELRSFLTRERDEFVASVAELRSDIQSFTLASLQESEDHEERIIWLSIIITLGAALSGLLFASFAASGLVRPIRRLLDGTQAVEDGKLDTELPVTTRDEIGKLTESFNHMVLQLRLKDRIKDTFGKYIDPRIVEELIRADAPVSKAEKRVVTVLFSDIAGFTSISEGMTPAGIVNLLNRYFTLMAQAIIERGGVIDKYIGDAIMAFWGPPFVGQAEHARLACLAALDQIPMLGEFQKELPELTGFRKGLPQIRFRIGIATGEVVVGNIGSEQTKSYTVMGDTVNLGSRLEGVNKHYGTTVMISEETRKLAADAIEARELDSIRVVGKDEPVRIYELLGRKGEVDPKVLEKRDQFEKGLAAYRSRDWEQARSLFEECRKLAPEDAPARVFLERLTSLRENPPGPGWDGVWQFTHK
jgi:adenylate cyclase